MANIFRRLWEKLRGKPKPQPPVILPGHRGIAIGLGTTPNTVNRRLVQEGEVADFLYDGQLLIVHSSNVRDAVYNLPGQKLIITYMDGATWEYSPVSEHEALLFAQSQSKGTFVWSFLRVRGKGNKHKHRKNAVRIR